MANGPDVVKISPTATVIDPGKIEKRKKMIRKILLGSLALIAVVLCINFFTHIISWYKLESILPLLNENFTITIRNFEEKNSIFYNQFERAYAENPRKVGPWKEKAFEVKKRSDEICEIIRKIIERTDIEKAGLYELLQSKVISLKNYLLSLTAPRDSSLRKCIESSLNTDSILKKEYINNWPNNAIKSLLIILANKVCNAESDAVYYLLGQVDLYSEGYYILKPFVIYPKNYVMKGDKFKAEIFPVAYDTTARIKVFVSKNQEPPYYDSVKGSYGYYEYKMFEDNAANYDSLPCKSGKGIYEVDCIDAGDKKLGGLIYLRAPSGDWKAFPFRGSYQVGEPGVIVTQNKMNVLYIGVDNPVEISAPGVRKDKIFPLIEGGGGSISKVNDGYVVRVTTPTNNGQLARISVAADIGGSLKKYLDSKYFRVEELPNPIAKVGGQCDGTISKTKLAGLISVEATLENFGFDVSFTVVQFDVAVSHNSFEKSLLSKSYKFTPEMLSLFKELDNNDRIIIENIKAIGPDGKKRKINPISLKIK